VRSTLVTEYELSRRRLLSDPRASSFVRVDEGEPAYLPFSGNDYDFASPALTRRGPSYATVTTLRTRCAACHGAMNTGIFSFAAQEPERMPPPRILAQPNAERAAFVTARKAERDDFTRLVAAAGLR
jgi:hypothetical protein